MDYIFPYSTRIPISQFTTKCVSAGKLHASLGTVESCKDGQDTLASMHIAYYVVLKDFIVWFTEKL